MQFRKIADAIIRIVELYPLYMVYDRVHVLASTVCTAVLIDYRCSYKYTGGSLLSTEHILRGLVDFNL